MISLCSNWLREVTRPGGSWVADLACRLQRGGELQKNETISTTRAPFLGARRNMTRRLQISLHFRCLLRDWKVVWHLRGIWRAVWTDTCKNLIAAPCEKEVAREPIAAGGWSH
jgi:hypothetical protein